MMVRSFARRALAVLVAFAFIAPALPLAPSVALATSPALGKVTATAAGKTFTLPKAESLVSTSGVVDSGAVTNWVNQIGASVDQKAADATLKVNKKKRRFDFKASKTGYKLDRPAAIALLQTKLAADALGGGDLGPYALPVTTIKPKVTKFGKTILVSLVQRKIYLYDNNKVVKTYRCAIGQPRYPTPTGTFHIGKKVNMPSWNNPGSAWAKNMPSTIGPGVNNPLGTRAMYLYTGATGGSDTGVRFHGVPHSEDPSIGHAASHGCMRMHRKDVENFFKRVSVGTKVIIIK